MIGPSPVVVLYSKPGCGMCDEARELLEALLADRARQGLVAPPIEERDITTDPAWEAANFLEIPVVEIGGRRLPLATSAAKLRRILGEALDGVPA
jgi:glutaredoxin